MSLGGGRGFLSSPRCILPLHPLHLETLPKMNVSQKGDSTHGLERWLGVKSLGD